MIISLDRNALKHLIDKDPDFELSLKTAVLSEIARRFFEKDAKKVIEATHPELFAKALETWQARADIMSLVHSVLAEQVTHKPNSYWSKVELAPEVKTLLQTEVDRLKRNAVENATNQIEAAYSAAINKALEAKFTHPELENRINNRLDRLIDAEIDRRVNEKLKERLASIQETFKV